MSIKIGDLDIHRRFYCVDEDIYLVMGTVRARSGPPAHVLGWVARHGYGPEKIIPLTERYIDLDSALRAFDTELAHKDILNDGRIVDDFQQERVYRWEERYAAPYTRPVSRAEARALCVEIALEHNIDPPSFVWGRECYYSEYDPGEHRVWFGHRDLVKLLHELAHVVHLNQLESGDTKAYHSPGFVRTVIGLYHKIGGIPLDVMVSSAHKRGLLGNTELAPYCPCADMNDDTQIPMIASRQNGINTSRTCCP